MTVKHLAKRLDEAIQKLCNNPFLEETEREEMRKDLIRAFGYEIISRTLNGDNITPESLTQPVVFTHFISIKNRPRAVRIWAECFSGIADKKLAKYMWRDITELSRRGIDTADILLRIGCDPFQMDKEHMWIAQRTLRLLLKSTPAPKVKVSPDKITEINRLLWQ